MTLKVKYCPREGFDVPLERCKKCKFYGGILNEDVYCTYEFDYHKIYED